MTIEYRYTDEDFQEANLATLSALGGNKPRAARKKSKSTARGIFGWVLFLSLAVMLFYLVKLHPSASGSGGSRAYANEPTQAPTHNFLQTLAVSTAAPLLMFALVSFVMSGVGRPSQVPFYSPRVARTKLPKVFWRALALLLAIAGGGAIVAVFHLPTALDWRPALISLLLVLLGPWFAVLFAITSLIAFASKRAKFKRGSEMLAVEGSTMVQPQTLEADDTAITWMTPLSTRRCGWDYFVSYLESENLLILYTRDLTQHIIPKRAFPAPESFQAFCGLVQTHVPVGQFLPRPAGFAVLPPLAQPVMEVDATGGNSVR